MREEIPEFRLCESRNRGVHSAARWVSRWLLGVYLFALGAFRAGAQGCAMCYQNAAASGVDGRAALRHGILILLFPSLAVFLGIFFLIFRRRNVVR